MKQKLKIIGLLVLAVLFTSSIFSFAQTNDPNTTNSIPGIGDVSHDAIPTSKEDLWKWAIAVVVPAIVLGIKKAVPRIPTAYLPMVTPLLGIGLGLVLKNLAGLNWGWVDMAQAGALAVFIRETFNQVVNGKLTNSSSTPSASAGFRNTIS